MAIQRYQLSVIKSPMGSGYIGMLTGSHFDGDPLTLYTMDEFGSMQGHQDGSVRPGKHEVQAILRDHGQGTWQERSDHFLRRRAV